MNIIKTVMMIIIFVIINNNISYVPHWLWQSSEKCTINIKKINELYIKTELI